MGIWQIQFNHRYIIYGLTMQSEVIKFPTNGALSSVRPHTIPINCQIGGMTLVGTLKVKNMLNDMR